MSLNEEPNGRSSVPTLSVVIVNFCVRHLLRACLTSLKGALEGIEAEIWVVDNASDDGSAEMVSADFPDVRLIANPKNCGFAKANNQVLGQAGAEFVLLLNPDTEVAPGVLQRLLAFMRENPRAGIAGPRLVGFNGETQTSARPFPRLIKSLAAMVGLKRGQDSAVSGEGAQATRRADWLSGAALLVRAEALQDVGLLDEAFFMYGEDVDWCRRFWDQGWEVWHLPEVSVAHWGGPSAARFNAIEGRRLWLEQSGRNEYLYFRKHQGRTAGFLVRATLLCASLASSLKWRLVALWRCDLDARRLSAAYGQRALQSWRGWG